MGTTKRIEPPMIISQECIRFVHAGPHHHTSSTGYGQTAVFVRFLTSSNAEAVRFEARVDQARIQRLCIWKKAWYDKHKSIKITGGRQRCGEESFSKAARFLCMTTLRLCIVRHRSVRKNYVSTFVHLRFAWKFANSNHGPVQSRCHTNLWSVPNDSHPVFQ